MNHPIKVEIVDSPDDGGFWISAFDTETEKSRASVQIFETSDQAFTAWVNNNVEWEEWR